MYETRKKNPLVTAYENIINPSPRYQGYQRIQSTTSANMPSGSLLDTPTFFTNIINHSKNFFNPRKRVSAIYNFTKEIPASIYNYGSQVPNFKIIFDKYYHLVYIPKTLINTTAKITAIAGLILLSMEFGKEILALRKADKLSKDKIFKQEEEIKKVLEELKFKHFEKKEFAVIDTGPLLEKVENILKELKEFEKRLLYNKKGKISKIKYDKLLKTIRPWAGIEIAGSDPAEKNRKIGKLKEAKNLLKSKDLKKIEQGLRKTLDILDIIKIQTGKEKFFKILSILFLTMVIVSFSLMILGYFKVPFFMHTFTSKVSYVEQALCYGGCALEVIRYIAARGIQDHRSYLFNIRLGIINPAKETYDKIEKTAITIIRTIFPDSEIPKKYLLKAKDPDDTEMAEFVRI